MYLASPVPIVPTPYFGERVLSFSLMLLCDESNTQKAHILLCSSNNGFNMQEIEQNKTDAAHYICLSAIFELHKEVEYTRAD